MSFIIRAYKYVPEEGYPQPYTTDIRRAKQFNTKEEAERAKIEGEEVIDLQAVIQQGDPK